MSSVRFSYSPLTAGHHEVGLAGDFSGWQILPLEDFGGIYLLAVDLPVGVYRYKLIVDGYWICDEGNPLKEADPFGGFNSVIEVIDTEPELRWTDAIDLARNKKAADHVKTIKYSESCIEVRFSWYNGLADSVMLHIGESVFPLHRIGKTALSEVYYCVIQLTNAINHNQLSPESVESFQPSPASILPFIVEADRTTHDNEINHNKSLLPNQTEMASKLNEAATTPCSIETLTYYIEITYQGKHRYLDSDGWKDNSQSLIPIPLSINDIPIFSIPDWVKSGIIYQIFPDRFYNGNPANDPDFSEWYYADCKTLPPKGEYLAPEQEYFHLVSNWNDISGLTQSPYLPKGKPDWWSFYGGDIAGVKAKLDYMQELSVDIIYFNPLWQAKSNHKYDSADYRSIDPQFATTAEMMEFVKIAHSKGIRIILDVAFNHTGETFWAFRDCVEKGSKSPYWNWYDWKKWPLPKPLPPDFKPKDYYQCWWGIKDMPDLNYDLSRHHPEENAVRNIKEARPNAALLDYLISTVRWWLLDIGIDGFRLDVPDEVPYWFWELFRREVKTAKPEAWIVGEIWHDAVSWVSPRYFDSVMNYAFFKNPVLEFFIFRLIGKQEFIERIETGLALYPFKALQVMMNLLGSHDTLRIFELCKGDLSGLKLAILFQMCFVGTPHIYYGDEIAMGGGKDPDNRRPFNWDWQINPIACELREHYRQLIQLRRSEPAFVEGRFSFVSLSELTISFIRELDDYGIWVVINPSPNHVPANLPPSNCILYGQVNNDGLLPPFSAIIYKI